MLKAAGDPKGVLSRNLAMQLLLAFGALQCPEVLQVGWLWRLLPHHLTSFFSFSSSSSSSSVQEEACGFLIPAAHGPSWSPAE